jgi:hypothetical protein
MPVYDRLFLRYFLDIPPAVLPSDGNTSSGGDDPMEPAVAVGSDTEDV